MLAAKSSAVDPANGGISQSLDLLREVLVVSPVLSQLCGSFSQTPSHGLQEACFWAESGHVELCAGMPVAYVEIQIRSCWHLHGLVVLHEDVAKERNLVHRRAGSGCEVWAFLGAW